MYARVATSGFSPAALPAARIRIPPRSMRTAAAANGSLPAFAGEAWAGLAERSGNLFATPDWLGAWWRHFGGGRELRIERSGDCIVPLYVWRSFPIRVLRLVGHGPSDVLGPICPPEDGPAPAERLREALEHERSTFSSASSSRRPAGSRSARRTRRAPHGRACRQVGGASWEEFLASRSANLREQVGRKERKLLHELGASYRLADDPDRLPRDLDVALLAAPRALGDGRLGLADPAVGAFRPRLRGHRARAPLATAWLLETGSGPIAAWYGFRLAGAEHYYNAGRDPSSDRYSAGFVLLAHTLRAALEDGVREYRFLRGGDAYKHRFATEDAAVETIAVTRGLLAGMALRAADRWRRRAAARRQRLDPRGPHGRPA